VEERTNRGQAVAADDLQVLQERPDRRRVQVGDAELDRASPGALLGEAEQEREGVAVGGDRVRAGRRWSTSACR
jgi:hypothetical protein